MRARFQYVIRSLGYHLKLFHIWVVLRIQGVPVKKYRWLLVIDGKHFPHPLRSQFQRKIIPCRRQTSRPLPKTVAGMNHQPLLYARTPLLK